MLPQPGLFGAGRRRWRDHPDPQLGGAAIPVSAVPANLSLRQSTRRSIGRTRRPSWRCWSSRCWVTGAPRRRSSPRSGSKTGPSRAGSRGPRGAYPMPADEQGHRGGHRSYSTSSRARGSSGMLASWQRGGQWADSPGPRRRRTIGESAAGAARCGT